MVSIAVRTAISKAVNGASSARRRGTLHLVLHLARRYRSKMKREQIQEQFKQSVERVRNGAAGRRRATETKLKGMVATYPWLRDYARLMGLSLMPGLTREFPWLAPAKASTKQPAMETRHTDATGPMKRGAVVSKERPQSRKSCATEAWVKPPTAPGLEYRQCYKRNCRCMNGGDWHGPYAYRKQRSGAVVRSEYLGREITSKPNE
jgi:hypothetical protein